MARAGDRSNVGRRLGFIGPHTFARFFRHSVHAVGVTTPCPLLRLDICCAALGAVLGWPPAGVPDEADDVWGAAERPEGPEADDDGRDESRAPPAELVTESFVSGIMSAAGAYAPVRGVQK